MVMKIDSEAIVSLKVTISYDDGAYKTQIVSEGDYVRVAYNHNGARRVVQGTVASIHANPYSSVTSKRDWYFNVINEDPEAVPHVAKIVVVNILDLEVIYKKHQSRSVGTPNDPTRVTHIRVVNGYLQVSQNEGHTWRTINEPLSNRPVPPDDVIAAKIEAMIGSDQYENADEFIKGIIELIHQEARKRRHRPWVEEPINPGEPAPDPNDLSGEQYANPEAHSAGMSVGPEISDFRYN